MICMYVSIAIPYSKSRDQLGKFAKPSHGQLNRENEVFLQMHPCCFHLFAYTFYMSTCTLICARLLLSKQTHLNIRCLLSILQLIYSIAAFMYAYI